MPFAFVGGKALYCIVMMSQFSDITFEKMIFGGFVFYGGFIGGAIGLMIFSVSKKISFLDIADVFVSLLPLGQAIGRIGCFLNGCCYGVAYEGWFSVKYPVGGGWEYVFPTWFVESIVCFALYKLLQKIISTKIRGATAGVYLTGYAVARFVLEFFRGDFVRGFCFGLSTSQIASVMCLIIGAIVIVVSISNKKTNKMII